MESISTWIAKLLMRAKALDKKGTGHAFGTPERILEDCQSLRKFWIPSDASADRLAPIFLGNRIKNMCDAIRLLGGTPPIISQSISSVDEGMREIDLIVKWCKSQETDDIEWSKAHSPTHWRKVYAVDGVAISQDTFRRNIKAGKIHEHPESTNKSIRIDKRDFPPDYTED